MDKTTTTATNPVLSAPSAGEYIGGELVKTEPNEQELEFVSELSDNSAFQAFVQTGIKEVPNPYTFAGALFLAGLKYAQRNCN